MAADTPPIVLSVWAALILRMRHERAALILTNIHARRTSGPGYIPTH